MAKNAGKLARRYAKALLLAVQAEQGTTGAPTPAQTLAVQLKELAATWDGQKEFSSSMLNPMFNKAERLEAFMQIVRTMGVSEIAQRFLRLVFERDRVAALPEIAASFEEQANEAAQVLKVEVRVAREVSDDEKNGIQARLAASVPGNLEFAWSIDEALIGGMVVRYGGKVLDASVSGRLQRIERTLMSGQ